MFEEFSKFAEAEKLLSKKLTGVLDAKIPRILGQGKTKAVGLELPPAPIERKQELISLEQAKDFLLPDNVLREIQSVRESLQRELKELCSEEGARSLASKVIRSLEVQPQGIKNNYFFVGKFLLIPDKKKLTWSWTITPHYPIIEKIPPDLEYLAKAYSAAEVKLAQMLMAPEEFESKLEMSWQMAQHITQGDQILLSDVARMFVVAAQDSRFWNSPQKRYFADIPEASFIANLLQYKREYRTPEGQKFEFVPATLNDAYRKNVYYLPLDNEGTQTRPYTYMIRKK